MNIICEFLKSTTVQLRGKKPKHQQYNVTQMNWQYIHGHTSKVCQEKNSSEEM